VSPSDPLLPPADDPDASALFDRSALDRSIRDSMETLRAHSPDPELRRLADDVLDGRRTLRDIAGEAAFGRAVLPALHQGFATLEALSDEDRAAFFDEARAAEVSSQPRSGRRTAGS
jgi:hypothetical protein